MKKTFYVFFALLFPALMGMAQVTVSYNSTAQPDGAFTVCGAAETNSMTITNGTAASLTGASLTLYIPTGGSYVAGSITGATQTNISNLSAPVFSVTSLPGGANTTITYQITFGCAVIGFQAGGGYTKESIDIGTYAGIAAPSTYNVVAAALSITGATNTSYTGNVGSSYSQTLSMANGGLGCVTSAYILLDAEGGSYSFSSPSIGTISHDTLFLPTANMPGGDGKWCNGETLNVTYTITINNCFNLNRKIYLAWGCNSINCQPSSAPQNSNVIIANNLPTVTMSIPNPNYNYCFTGGIINNQIRLVNTGAGPATNLSIYLFRGNGWTSFDTTQIWNVRDKHGNVIGQMKNFTGYIMESRNTASCNSVKFMQQGTGSLGNVILAANDTIYVDMWEIANNFNCTPDFCSDINYWVEDRGYANYKNQCGTASYATGTSNTSIISRSYYYFLYTVTNPIDINGYAPNNTFNITLDFAYLSTTAHPSGSGSVYLILPGLSSLNIAPTATSAPLINTSNNSTYLNLPINVKNDTMWVGPFTQNSGFTSSQLTIPMQATCGTGGVKTMNFSMLAKYDSTCPGEKYFRMGCRTSTITVHCPAPCPKGGLTPVGFTLQRINYGQPDNNNDHIPDASGTIDLTKIATHSVVNADTVQGTWNVKVYPNADPTDAHFGQVFTNAYLDFNLGKVAYPGYMSAIHSYLTPLPNAQVTIYPAGGGAAINCTVTPTLFDTVAHYDFSTCKSSWNSGDSLVVKANFTINATLYMSYINSAAVIKYVTNNLMYATYSTVSTPISSLTSGVDYSCDAYNDYLNVMNIWIHTYDYPTQIINGCTNTLTTTFGEALRQQNDGNNLFPYEYRNFYIPSKYYIRIPHGFVYRSNTAQFLWSGTHNISNANVSQVGDTLIFSNLQTFFTPYGGTIVPPDERAWVYQINFSIDPTCSAVAGVYAGNAKVDGIGNGVNTPTSYLSYEQYPALTLVDSLRWDSPLTAGQANTYYYYPPLPVLAGGGTQTTNTGTATWTIQLQNQSNSTAAANSYFYFSQANSFTNIVVKQGSTVIIPDANGFYELGSLAASANLNFTITADLGRCSLDSMQLYEGWGCTGYPTAFTASSCMQNTWLKAGGYPTGIDAIFTPIFPNSNGTITMCQPFSVQTLINSTLVGNLASETYKVVLPPHISYVSNSVQVIWPVGGSYTANTYNPTVISAASGDTLVFSVNALTGNSGLTGVGDLVHKAVNIQFNLQSSCGYISNSQMQALYSGISVCGDTLSSFAKTARIKLYGVNPGGTVGLNLSLPALTYGCGQTFMIPLMTQPLGTSTQSGDTVVYTLPAGLSYSAGSFTGGYNCSSCTATVSTNASGNTLVKVALQTGVAGGDSLKYSIGVTPSGLGGCGSSSITAEAYRNVSGIMCGATTCAASTAIFGSATSSITLVKPSPVITNMKLISGRWASSGTATVAITITNNGTQDMVASSYYVEFFCGNNTSPTAIGYFPSAVLIGQTVTANMTITIGSGCPNGSLITAKIRQNSALGTPQCLCSETSFTMAEALPITLSSFTAAESNCRVVLYWKSAIEDNFSHYEVEYSADGLSYTSQTIISGKGGNQAYSYTGTPVNGVVYYRLKMVGKDGQISYSWVAVLKVYCQGKNVIVYPNPATGQFTINVVGLTGAVKGELYNALGQLVLSRQLVSGNNQVITSGMSSGVYSLVVTDSAGLRQTIKINIR